MLLLSLVYHPSPPPAATAAAAAGRESSCQFVSGKCSLCEMIL